MTLQYSLSLLFLGQIYNVSFSLVSVTEYAQSLEKNSNSCFNFTEGSIQEARCGRIIGPLFSPAIISVPGACRSGDANFRWVVKRPYSIEIRSSNELCTFCIFVGICCTEVLLVQHVYSYICDDLWLENFILVLLNKCLC